MMSDFVQFDFPAALLISSGRDLSVRQQSPAESPLSQSPFSTPPLRRHWQSLCANVRSIRHFPLAPCSVRQEGAIQRAFRVDQGVSTMLFSRPPLGVKGAPRLTLLREPCDGRIRSFSARARRIAALTYSPFSAEREGMLSIGRWSEMAYDGVISLVSDTETRPTDAMRRAIASAEVGDEQKGQDPTVNRLQERVAELLGKEAALWFPGGTMCNFVAVRVHTRPADAIVADWMSHIIRAESAGVAVSSGVFIEPIMTERGVFTPAELDAALGRIVTTPSPYSPPPRLVCVEQTHNFGGGAVWSLPNCKPSPRGPHAGARHAHGRRAPPQCRRSLRGSAPRRSQRRWTASGSISRRDLARRSALSLQARRTSSPRRADRTHLRRGNAAGRIAAAGCLYALDHYVERLAEDHVNARGWPPAFCEIKASTSGRRGRKRIWCSSIGGAGTFKRSLHWIMAQRGVRVGEVRGEIRAVLHLDVSAADVETALTQFARSRSPEPPRSLTPPPSYVKRTTRKRSGLDLTDGPVTITIDDDVGEQARASSRSPSDEGFGASMNSAKPKLCRTKTERAMPRRPRSQRGFVGGSRAMRTNQLSDG